MDENCYKMIIVIKVKNQYIWLSRYYGNFKNPEYKAESQNFLDPVIAKPDS